MLESLWIKEEVENKLLNCFAFAFSFTVLSIFIVNGLMPFRINGISYSGLVAVLLVCLAATYPLVRYLRKEEHDEMISRLSEKRLLTRHRRELNIYLSFFLGVTFAFAFLSYLLPANFFEVQLQTLSLLPTGQISSNPLFNAIITNNLWVFFITFVLSFFISAGVVFILVWNASVLGVFFSKISNSLLHVPLVSLAYLPHGLLEISAYILAGIGGTLLSHQFSLYKKRGYNQQKFVQVSMDVVTLVVVGLGLLLAAGILEVI